MSDAPDLPDEFFVTEEDPKDTAIPLFFWEAKRFPGKEAAAGHAVFELVPWVQIILPEDKNSVPIREVSEADKERWPSKWRAFEEKGKNRPSGTPIEQFPMLDLAQVSLLKHYGVLTVEALAALSLEKAKSIGGESGDTETLQQKAQAWLRAQSEEVAGAAARIDELQAQNEQLTAQLAELRNRENTPTDTTPKPRRGRPPKQKAPADVPADVMPSGSP